MISRFSTKAHSIHTCMHVCTHTQTHTHTHTHARAEICICRLTRSCTSEESKVSWQGSNVTSWEHTSAYLDEMRSRILPLFFLLQAHSEGKQVGGWVGGWVIHYAHVGWVDPHCSSCYKLTARENRWWV